MKKIILLVLATFAIPGLIFADGFTSISAYAIPVASSAKSPSTITGIYTYMGYDAYSLELEYDKSTSTTSNSGQQNAVIVFTNHATPYAHFRLGLNQIQPDNGRLASVIMLGAMFDQYNYYWMLDTKIGADFYAGFYNNNGNKITALQLDPSITHYFGSSIIPGWITVTSKARIQQLSQDLGHGKILTGAQFIVKDDLYPFSISGKMWVGSSQFGVYDDGFAVYNNTDLMGNGLALSCGFSITPKLNLTVGYQNHTIRVDGASADADLAKTMVMVSYSL